MKNLNCCYVGTIREFLDLKEDCTGWIKEMESQFEIVYPHFERHKLEIDSWKDTFHVLQDALMNIEAKDTTYIVFEYKLPEEGGRRPDVLLINSKQICVLEFKKKNSYDDANLDQVIAYARDLKDYHEKSRNMEVKPFLILTESDGRHIEEKGQVQVVSPNRLPSMLKFDQIDSIDIESWLESNYEPLPSIIESFQKLVLGRIPVLFQSHENNLQGTEKLLDDIVLDAKKRKKIILVVLLGDTGTGKTCLGLRLVSKHLADKALYCSANSSLANTLYSTLEEPYFIKRLDSLYSENTFGHHIVVLDEAQRIGNVENWRNPKYHKVLKEQVISMMGQEDWGVLVINYALGQIFKNGEHEGLSNWKSQIEETDPTWKKWEIAFPKSLIKTFMPDQWKKDFISPSYLHIHRELQLVFPLRQQRGYLVSSFVNALLNNDFATAKNQYTQIDPSYAIYITNDLSVAENYCYKRYRNDKSKHYGAIQSSQSSISIFPILEWDKSKKSYGKWFTSVKTDWKNYDLFSSSNDFSRAANEEQCQGMELDMPVVIWGDDLIWKIGAEQNFYEIESDFIELHQTSFQSKKVKELEQRYNEKFLGYDDIITQVKIYPSKNHDKYLLLQHSFLKGSWRAINPQLPSNKKMYEISDLNFPNRSYRINHYEKISYVQNIYRVLLTRGRDGIILYIPPVEELGDTYKILKALGLKVLQMDKTK